MATREGLPSTFKRSLYVGDEAWYQNSPLALSRLPRRLVMNEHRTALSLFALALAIATVIAAVTTFQRVNTHRVSHVAVPGTTGLAKPHQQLDRAPGEPIANER